MWGTRKDKPTKKEALATIRLMWAAMLCAQAAFAGWAVYRNWAADGTASMDPEMGRMFFYVLLSVAGIGLPVGYYLRLQDYKKHWHGDAISPEGYVNGNIMLLAMCEGIGLFSIVCVVATGQWWPYVLITGVAVLVQLLNWPNGLAMEPAELTLE